MISTIIPYVYNVSKKAANWNISRDLSFNLSVVAGSYLKKIEK